VIEMLFEAISSSGFPSLQAEGCEAHGFPLFAVLDGKDSADYEQRVEPSVQGGRKIAEALLDAVLADDTATSIAALMMRQAGGAGQGEAAAGD